MNKPNLAILLAISAAVLAFPLSAAFAPSFAKEATNTEAELPKTAEEIEAERTENIRLAKCKDVTHRLRDANSYKTLLTSVLADPQYADPASQAKAKAQMAEVDADIPGLNTELSENKCS